VNYDQLILGSHLRFYAGLVNYDQLIRGSHLRFYAGLVNSDELIRLYREAGGIVSTLGKICSNWVLLSTLGKGGPLTWKIPTGT
jgi:hypothetical protein